MEVKLIDYTGAGSPDPANYAARLLIYTKNTRLTQGDETLKRIYEMPDDAAASELDYIAKTIRSSWEFISYTFQVTGVTRAYTHQQVRTRHASYAQQAQRVVDMSNFETLMPETIKTAGLEGLWNNCMMTIAATYRELHNAGVPAQDCRGVLPTNVLTNIIVKIDLRAFADLVGKRENLRAQDEYARVVAAMKAEVLRVHPWTGPYIDPERRHTPAIDAIMRNALNGSAPTDKPEINNALKELDALKAIWG